MLPVVFAHSVVVSRFLHHTTLHSTQNTSLVSSVVLYQSPQKAPFSVRNFFCHCYPLLSFLTAVHVATDITPQVFEAAHFLNGFTFNPYIYLLWLSSDNHVLRFTYLFSSHNPRIFHVAPSACSSASFHLLLAKPYHRQILSI